MFHSAWENRKMFEMKNDTLDEFLYLDVPLD